MCSRSQTVRECAPPEATVALAPQPPGRPMQLTGRWRGGGLWQRRGWLQEGAEQDPSPREGVEGQALLLLGSVELLRSLLLLAEEEGAEVSGAVKLALEANPWSPRTILLTKADMIMTGEGRRGTMPLPLKIIQASAINVVNTLPMNTIWMPR